MRDSDQNPITEEALLHLEGLTPPRVGLEKDTRMPVVSAPKGVSKMDPANYDKKLSMLMAAGEGKIDSYQGQRRGGRREAPATDERNGMGSPDSSSSWLPRR